MGQNVTLARQNGNPTFSSLIVTGPTNLSGSFFNSGSITTANNLVVSGSATFINSLAASGSVAFDLAKVKFIGGNSYNENIRCTAQSNDYSSIILGAVAGDSGTGAGQWSLVRWPSSNSYKFTIRYNTTDNFTIDTSGNLTMVGNVTAYSDARVKTNIKTIDNALSKVLALRGVTYNRTDLEDKSEQIGVIAQEIKEILPQVVQENEGHYSVAYGNIVGVLIEAIKEQQSQIEELKARL